MLDHDSDRNTRTQQIVMGGERIDVYALRVFEKPETEPDYEQEIDTKPARRVMTRKVKVKPSRKTELKKSIVKAKRDLLEISKQERKEASKANRRRKRKEPEPAKIVRKPFVPFPEDDNDDNTEEFDLDSLLEDMD